MLKLVSTNTHVDRPTSTDSAVCTAMWIRKSLTPRLSTRLALRLTTRSSTFVALQDYLFQYSLIREEVFISIGSWTKSWGRGNGSDSPMRSSALVFTSSWMPITGLQLTVQLCCAHRVFYTSDCNDL